MSWAYQAGSLPDMKNYACNAFSSRENAPFCFSSELLGSFAGIVHGFASRKGGVSIFPCDSLNVGIASGDCHSSVIENRNIVAGISGIKRSVYLSQIHGSDVFAVKKGRAYEFSEPVKADAVVTDEPDLLLVIQTADCQAILLHDPVRNVVAAVHSGWKGNVANIPGKTVAVMTDSFGCNPLDIRASTGPSLGVCCAEFVNYRNELPESFWKYRTSDDHFDFWAISRAQLEASGLKTEHVDILGLCTRCDEENFFSYRRNRVTGRMANFIALKGDR